MDLKRYEELSQGIISKANEIENKKRPAYIVGSPDVLANFKNVGKRLGITPSEALGVYFLKHIDAITSLLRDPGIPQAEEIEGRFADAINYLKLAWALVNEENE